MKSPAIFIIISGSALIAAAVIFNAPKTTPSAANPRIEAKQNAGTKIRKKLKYKGDVDSDYIQAFRKCNAGLQEYCEGERSTVSSLSAEQAEKLVPSVAGGIKAPVYVPIVFNELMVRTAIKFATRKGQCRRNSCDKSISTDAEQFRIYSKVLKEARTGCSRRQLDACIIEGDIYAADLKFSEAREVMRKGAKLAKVTVSRCDGGSEPDQNVCKSYRTQLEVFNSKSKVFGEALLQSH